MDDYDYPANAIDMFTGNTPWGRVQQHENLGMGVMWCSTASHGGFFVPKCMLHNIPKRRRLWAARWSGSEQWFEEDCCWAAVALAFPDMFQPADLKAANAIMAHYDASEVITP